MPIPVVPLLLAGIPLSIRAEGALRTNGINNHENRTFPCKGSPRLAGPVRMGQRRRRNRSASTPNVRLVYTVAAELLSVLADTVVDFEFADRGDRVGVCCKGW